VLASTKNSPAVFKFGFRQKIALLAVGGYLILNWFFMLIRIPPVGGGGVPIGEILLIVWLCFIYKDLRWLPSFTNNIIFVPFLIWWIYGISRAVLAVPEHGMWALRDANHVIESLFLWVGFVCASTPDAMDRLFVWLRRVLFFGVLYSFTYPWREALSGIGPSITAAGGYQANLFSFHMTSGVLLIWEATRRLIELHGKTILVSTFLLAYAIGMFQARTIYLQVIAVILMLGWHRPKALRKMGLAIGAGLLGIILIAQSGIEIKGRNQQNISIDYLVKHFIAIAGIKSKGVESAAGGVSERLGWWENIIKKLTDNTGNFLFGLGYGLPLIDFHGSENQVVREPHNSYISVLGRLGLLGAILFTWMHVHLVRAWLRAYNLCRQMDFRLGQDRLFLLMVYFVLIWVFSLGEDAFEKPYLTIPYYFFWGVVLHYRIHLKNYLLGDPHRD
jgi:hypothetical protein